MAKVPASFKCDGPGCHAVRTETNHWWLVAPPTAADTSTLIFPWDDGQAEKNDMLRHLCGQECLLKKVAEIVSKQSTIPAPKSSPKVVNSKED